MANILNIKKGLDLPIAGAATLRVAEALSIDTYAVKPTDFVGLVPRLSVAEGDKVAAGDALFVDKNNPDIRFTSPVAGSVKAVVRGEKRRLLAVVVQRDEQAAAASFQVDASSAEQVRSAMLRTGLWTMLRQRPFGTVANPTQTPKAIVVSAFDSAPLAADTDFALQGRESFFTKGLDALAKLTDGPLHVSFRPEQKLMQAAHAASAKNIQIHQVTGVHPAGNVGTQIAAFCPINKGDLVWTMGPQDVAVLGELVSTGVYNPVRVVAVAGPACVDPHYYRVRCGAAVASIVKCQGAVTATAAGGATRIVSGNVLCGTQIAADGYLSAYDALISMLPEGDYYDFMGWLLPGLKKFSFSRTFLSGFFAKCKCDILGKCSCTAPKFDTNMHGSVRPLVFSGNFEQVFPFDIYPTQLIKACIIGDLELMENLGIYEVEPEDFALCEFIDPSKTDIQPIIREALELLRKEAM